MKHIHYGWVICLTCTLLIFISIGIAANSFSTYLPYMMEEFGLTNTQSSTILTVRCFVTFLGTLIVSQYFKLFNLRTGCALAAGFTVIGYVMFSFATNFWGFAIAGIFTGLSFGVGGMVPVAILINNWFDDHQALAVGMCSAGSGLATIIMPPIIAGLIAKVGLSQTFRLEAVFCAVCVVVIYVILRDTPEEKGMKKLGADYKRGTESKEVENNFTDNTVETEALTVDVSFREIDKVDTDSKSDDHGNQKNICSGETVKVFTTLQLVLLFFMSFFNGTNANPGINHMSVLYSAAGFAPMFVATIFSLQGISMTLGKVLLGGVIDKIGGYKSGLIFFGMLFVGNILCTMAGLQNATISILSALIAGAGYALPTIIPSATANDLAPQSEYARIVKNQQIAYQLGALVIQSVPGILADRFGGSYVPAYIMFTVFTVFSIVLFILAYKKKSGIKELE